LAHRADVEGAEDMANKLDGLVRRTVVDYLLLSAHRPEKNLVQRTCKEMDVRIFERFGEKA
jgi:hypothetical protein